MACIAWPPMGVVAGTHTAALSVTCSYTYTAPIHKLPWLRQKGTTLQSALLQCVSNRTTNVCSYKPPSNFNQESLLNLDVIQLLGEAECTLPNLHSYTAAAELHSC
eukprot:GHRR01003642.1.p2 GENE.GHRR01003642.1~~GHRR01003642.1.p2  ORF type:complete len:106 (-),score=7.66 GHRR01003642.1:491-808(-)